MKVCPLMSSHAGSCALAWGRRSPAKPGTVLAEFGEDCVRPAVGTGHKSGKGARGLSLLLFSLWRVRVTRLSVTDPSLGVHGPAVLRSVGADVQYLPDPRRGNR